MTLGESLARGGLPALAVGVVTAITPAAAPAHHVNAARICEQADPHHSFYQHWYSAPILINGAGGRRVGRIAIATPALGLPDWKFCRGVTCQTPMVLVVSLVTSTSGAPFGESGRE